MQPHGLESRLWFLQKTVSRWLGSPRLTIAARGANLIAQLGRESPVTMLNQPRVSVCLLPAGFVCQRMRVCRASQNGNGQKWQVVR